MHVITAKFKLYFLLLIFPAIILVLLTCGCDKKQDNKQEKKEEKKSTPVYDKPLADFQYKLLDTAFETATLIPVKPLIKDRSKAQEAVVETALELGQPKKAYGYIEKIDDWRRGSAYASLAYYYAENGADANHFQQYMDSANKIASEEGLEDWRRDTIKVKIAQVYALINDAKQAAKFQEGIVDSEKGKVVGVASMAGSEESFNEQMNVLDELIASQNFDIVKNALESGAQLFNAYYTNLEKRTLIEEKIKNSWKPLPIFIRGQVLMKMAEFALEHADKTKAIELVNESQALLSKDHGLTEDYVSTMAKLSRLRFLAGDVQKAYEDVNSVIAVYDAQKMQIIDVYRAGVLRPLAQAYMSMGDKAAALAIYKRAIEEGAGNPNSRPRAEDLSATCCSMVLSGLEPDAQLWTRILQIKNGLNNPW